MNRPLRDRLTALLAAALFLLSGAGDAFGAHPCPHHAAIAAQPSTAAPADQASPAAHHAHAEHPVPAAPAEHDSHDACTCVDGLCPVGAAPLPASGSGHLPVLALSPAPAARTDDATLPARRVPHFLPFAQAPPPQA